MEKISERYKKALVTVAMGFRTEDDIRKNGLYRFTKQEKESLIEYVTSLFNKRECVLALKIKETGYRSEHININSKTDLEKFINYIFESNDYDEIWIVSSSVIDCWRCRIYLSKDSSNDIFEMAYSSDDHILDHIVADSNCPYVCYKKDENKFEIFNSNLDKIISQEATTIMNDIITTYSHKFEEIRHDLKFIGINGISLDIRANDGYDFHDFDVSYKNTEKVINYYFSRLKVKSTSTNW